MPVVTRSCGRQEVRRRIEDTTPRRPYQTTVKRKKDNSLSDEDSEKPAKKKHNSLTVRLDKIAVTPKPTQGPQTSRIPRRCTAKKVPMKDISHPSEKDILNTSAVEKSKPESPQSHSPTSETPIHATPVAARTRSFSALKRSYIAKKSQRHKSTTIHNPSSSEEGIIVNAMIKAKLNDNIEGVVSSNNENDDVEMTEEHKNTDVSSGEQTKDEFYKAKFHELLQHMKGIQETFDNAQKNATKNIEAYDALIKELKESLEKEKTKVTNTTQELQMTKDQLLVAQEQLEKTDQKTSEVNIQPKSSNAANEKVHNFQSKIQFYQMLSGISLTEEPDSVQSFQSYQCVYKPKGFQGKAMHFRLTYDKEIEEVEFSPVIQSPSSGEFLQKMPKYLKENIYFSTDQAPGFLLRLIQSYKNQH